MKISRRHPKVPRPFRPHVARAPEGAVQLRYAGTVATEVPESSDVTSLRGSTFLTVSDTQAKAAKVNTDLGERSVVELPGLDKVSGLEGAAFHAATQTLFLGVEEKRQLLRLHWDPDSNEAPVLEARFDLPKSNERNSGVEGMALLPRRFSPTGADTLLVAQEKRPIKLWWASASGEGEFRPVALPPALLKKFADVSALTVDPVTGHLFLASDESSSLAELTLSSNAAGDVDAKLVALTPLRDSEGRKLLRVEGAAFDDQGTLFVLTENDGLLHRMERVEGKAR